MQTAKVTISAPTGLHARPAGELVKLVKGFTGSAVVLATAAKSVNAGSMLSVLSLGLKCGTEVEVSVTGGDEPAVLSAVVSFLQNVKD